MLWEILPNKAVGVLVHAACPRVIGTCKIDMCLKCFGHGFMARELSSIIVGYAMNLFLMWHKSIYDGPAYCQSPFCGESL